MIVFSVAIPVDAPEEVVKLVRNIFKSLRSALEHQKYEGAIFGEAKQEGKDEQEHQVQG